MPLNVTWTENISQVITNSDFGFLGNLVPLVLIIGISWFLSKKPREMMFIQFPLVLGFRVFFPFLHVGIVVVSLAIFIMNLIGSKGDLLADIKETPQRVRDNVMIKADMLKQASKAFEKQKAGDTYAELRAEVFKKR